MILEDIISECNTKKTFKFLALILLSLPALQYGSQMQNILLSIYAPNYKCQYYSEHENYTISQDQCSVSINGSTIECSSWNFSTVPVGQTMVSDYSLVCDSKGFGDASVIIWYGTNLIQPFMGWLSDRFGRKPMAFLNFFIEIVSLISLTQAPNIYSNMLFRVFIGISGNGLYICYVWLLEMVDIEYRGFAGSFYFFYSYLAEMIFPLIAYYSKDWRKTQLLSMIPSIMYMFILILPESPRWLNMKNRKQDAVKSLKFIGKVNKIKVSVSPEEIDEELDSENESIFEALKEPIFSTVLTLTVLAVLTSNFSLSLMVVKQDFFNKNIYISIFIQGLLDLPSVFLSYCFIKYWKRKFSFILLNATGISFLMLSSLFSMEIVSQFVIRTVLACIAKVCLLSSTTNIIIYILELYPTTHRTFGIATVQIANLISFSGALYITRLDYIYYIILNVINFLLMCFVNIMIYRCLPETKGLPLPETTADQKMFRVGNEELFLSYMQEKSGWIRRRSMADIGHERTKLLTTHDN